MREGKKGVKLAFMELLQHISLLTRQVVDVLSVNIHNQPPGKSYQPSFRWENWALENVKHMFSWTRQGRRRSQGFVETFLCLAKKPDNEAVLWMNLWMCIMFSMKCLFTVVGYLRVDFNERNDVLISYIEMPVNFDVFKICNWKQLLVKKSKWLPLWFVSLLTTLN